MGAGPVWGYLQMFHDTALLPTSTSRTGFWLRSKVLPLPRVVCPTLPTVAAILQRMIGTVRSERCWHCRGALSFLQLGSELVHDWTLLVGHCFQGLGGHAAVPGPLQVCHSPMVPARQTANCWSEGTSTHCHRRLICTGCSHKWKTSPEVTLELHTPNETGETPPRTKMAKTTLFFQPEES